MSTKFDRLNHDDIINDFKNTNSITKTSNNFNIEWSMVKKVLITYGLILNKKRTFVEDLNHEEIIAKYNELRDTILTSKEFNISPSTIQKILHLHNIKIFHIKYTDDEIIRAYKKYGTISKTADELKIVEKTISDILKKNKIEINTFIKKISIGDVFGDLIVVSEIENYYNSKGNSQRQFFCICNCGGSIIKKSRQLIKSSDKSSCGCRYQKIRDHASKIKKEKENKKILYDEQKKKWEEKRIERENNRKVYGAQRKKYIVGFKKDRLTIIEIIGKGDNRKVTVECECGNTKVLNFISYRKTKSCGCLQIERSTKHGLSPKKDESKRKWYDRWRGMVKRCYNPKCHAYKNYGMRGISVCDRWLEPDGVGCKNYIDDIFTILGKQPGDNYSLDRLDNDGNYCIENMRWATNSEQTKNQRRNIKNNGKS